LKEADLVKQYAESQKIAMQKSRLRLRGIYEVPEMVRCRCIRRPIPKIVGGCAHCAMTGRVPIPWAEVMNVR
jgi:hypothetical protein